MSRKKIHRFMMSSPVPDTDTFEIIDERIVHQVGHVLKMDPGEEIILFADGSGDSIVRIDTSSKKSLIVSKVRYTDPLPFLRTVIAAVAIPKGDTFELIVQKLTELGVRTIVPLITDRTIKKTVRLDRLQTISDEAVEQCGGNTRVHITEPMSIKESLAQFPFTNIAFEPGASTDTDVPDDTIVMYVGPEGGWSDAELAHLTEHGVKWQALSTRILRTETAALVAAFSLLY